MEKKKMKIWQKILIILGIVFAMYIITVVYKFNVLTKFNETFKKDHNMYNFYYYGENEERKIEHWQKDGIVKNYIDIKKNTGNLIMWENTNTGEKYTFVNGEQKVYQEGGETFSKFGSWFYYDNTIDIVKDALNPCMIIYPMKYDDMNCLDDYEYSKN